jgi:hypothetical protein
VSIHVTWALSPFLVALLLLLWRPCIHVLGSETAHGPVEGTET